MLRHLFDDERADFVGTHYTLENAPNYPKPKQGHLPIWIGGGGEKRTLPTTARYADGWNVPYYSPEEFARRNAVLDGWCDRVGRDPKTITRTVNVGFYLGADANGRRRAEERYAREWPTTPRWGTGFLRGDVATAVGSLAAYAAVGVQQLNIALRTGPYDWDGLEAFAERVMPQLR